MISNLIQELENEGYVMPAAPGPLKVGRPPNALKLNPEAGYILGLDIGHTHIKAILLNLLQEIVVEQNILTTNIEDSRLLLRNLIELKNRVLKHTGIRNDQILGTGVAIPGLVNSSSGWSYTYLSMEDQGTRQMLEEALGTVVRIENDVKAMALAELEFGQARNLKNVACVNLGWGIGMGLILNGSIYYGKSGFAGEFGHITVVDNGALCHCGKRGCLETVSSGRAIGEIARNRLKNGEQSRMKDDLPALEDIDEEKVVRYARKGDLLCIEILQNAGEYLGRSIGEIINLFNPELIILGGRGSEAGEFILHPIRTAALRHSLVELGLDTKIVCSELGDRAGCLGATTLITREIFDIAHIDVSRYV
jgi:glucokinase-like ROK family protein